MAIEGPEGWQGTGGERRDGGAARRRWRHQSHGRVTGKVEGAVARSWRRKMAGGARACWRKTTGGVAWRRKTTNKAHAWRKTTTRSREEEEQPDRVLALTRDGSCVRATLYFLV
jgi:hypothetical protein